jgi:hypothetical protein
MSNLNSREDKVTNLLRKCTDSFLGRQAYNIIKASQKGQWKTIVYDNEYTKCTQNVFSMYDDVEAINEKYKGIRVQKHSSCSYCCRIYPCNYYSIYWKDTDNM